MEGVKMGVKMGVDTRGWSPCWCGNGLERFQGAGGPAGTLRGRRLVS